MSQFNEAADQIRRIAKTLEGFKAAADILDRTGSLENAAKEAQKALDVAKKAKAKAEAELEAVTANVNAAKDEAVALVAAAKEEASAMSRMMLDDAEKNSNKIMVLTQQQVMMAQQLRAAQEDKAKEDLEILKAKITESTQVSSILDVEIAVKQKQLDSLNQSLEKLKAKLA